jgi:hypothetical protein
MAFATYVRLGVPVSATSREVIRATYRRLAPHALTREHREGRHRILREMLEHHRHQQNFCIHFLL